jgi:hypothetical protein
LATLRPDALRRICVEAAEPFYDDTLEERTDEARDDWEREAQEELDQHVDDDLLVELHAKAEAKLAGVREEIEAINEQLRMATHGLGISFESPVLPEPELPEGVKGKPLLSSA